MVSQLLIHSTRILADARRKPFEGGLFVVGARVQALLTGERAVARCATRESLVPLDLGDRLITPGLVNAHAHTELGELGGRLDGSGSFADWIAALLRERAGFRAQDFDRAVRRGAHQQLDAGTTTLADVDSSGAAERVLAAVPMRSVVQREVLDAAHPARTEPAIDRVREALPRHELRLEGLAPHAPFTVSGELLQRLAALAMRRRIGLAIHWAETEEEVRWLRDGEGPLAPHLGPSPRHDALEHLARAGLLEGRDPRVPLALIHANHPARGDRQRLARVGAVVVHCPGTHAFFGREAFPLEEWLAAGVPVALGTDSLASNERLELPREMALLRRTAPGLAPREVLELATRGGAAALGLRGAVGVLQAGAWADWVAWDTPAGEDPVDALTSGEARAVGVWVAARRLRPGGVR